MEITDDLAVHLTATKVEAEIAMSFFAVYTRVLLFELWIASPIALAEDFVLWRCESKLITVTEVHVPSDDVRGAEDLRCAFATCYVKGDPIHLDLKVEAKIISFLIKSWEDGNKESASPKKEDSENGPVGLEVPPNLVMLQSKGKKGTYLLRLTPYSASLEKLNKPIESADVYFSDHKASSVEFDFPEEYSKVLFPK